jgi:hypothetical protein
MSTRGIARRSRGASGIKNIAEAAPGHYSVGGVNLSPTPERIVADGPFRFRRSREHGILRARILAEARQRRGAELKGAPFWRRAWLGLIIEREARAELRRLHPPGALYLAGGAR